VDNVIDFINVNRERYLDELKAFLAIPSISALPQHAGDVKACADWCAGEMRRIGMENVKLVETPGNPVVYGDWLHAPGAPTILFYGHYDVQPVDPLELWASPPFEATIRDGEIYARGSADDKGQVFMHFKAIEAHVKQNGKLPVNMKIILEGEEEVGSVNLDNFIRDHKSELVADVVVISDSGMFARGVPSICYGLRGLVYFQIDLRGSSTDLHSGSFGGAVANPAFVLSQILSQMKDRGGHIKIPGFYDDVVALQEEERAAWATLPYNEKQYKKDFGIPKVAGETGFTTLERTWARPTFEVNGLLSGFTGEGAKTVLPAVAMAKVSMRLVPNQTPDKIAELFEAHLRDVTPKTVELKITRMHGGKPWMTSYDNPFVQAAGRAIERGFGRKPVFTREGGSIPVVSTFQEELGLPSVLFGVGLPDENAHAPNEKLDVANFHGGIISSAILYEEIAKK
jgi:acetylornithine deacetylase/succinyl-diaminopimelate desuccinylase-like protein